MRPHNWFTFQKPSEKALSPSGSEFCLILIKMCGEVLGADRVREILRSTFGALGKKGALTTEGLPDFEEATVEILRTAVTGVTSVLSKGFGTSFAENTLRQIFSKIQKKYPPEVIARELLPIIPAGFLENEKVRFLSKEELEKEIATKTVELQRSNELLEDRINERTKDLHKLLGEQERAAQMLIRRDLELTRANDRLRKLDEVKSGFISVVAHQLRTPLSGIKWTLNLLLSGDMGTLATEQKTFLMKAYESNERMIGLVNDMLGADRIESDKVRYLFQPVQLVDIVDNVLYEVLPQAKARNLSIRFGSPVESIPKVSGDPEKLRAVFQNLLENSIKYSRAGGFIEIGIRPQNHSEVLVSIQDNGIGIPKEQQKNIFERFFRARNAIKAETDGSGLGLFIVKSIIERHGGNIWFTSEEEKGVTFFFTLPASQTGVDVQTPTLDNKQVNGVKLG